MYMMNKDEVLKMYNSRLSGLNQNEVLINQKKYGKNIITKKKNKSVFKTILSSLTEPMMLILLIACLFTFIIALIDYFRYEILDLKETIGILLAILLSTSINLWMEIKTRNAFKNLKKIESSSDAFVIRNNSIHKILGEDLVVGDIVLFNTGDKIPADCRIIESNYLEVNEATLTGEGNSVFKNSHSINKNVSLAERKNMAYFGTYVVGGSGKGVVCATGDNTELGKIALNLSEDKKELTPLEENLNKLTKKLVLFGVFVAIIMFFLQLINLIIKNKYSSTMLNDLFLTSIIYIVSALPEGLPSIVAISLALNVLKMSKQNALVRQMKIVETVGRINVICSDKTGTLTKGNMTVTNVYENDNFVNKINSNDLINNILYNNSLKIVEGKPIGNLTEVALYNYLNLKKENKNVEIIEPFSSQKKYMVIGIDNKYFIKGAPEIVIEKTRLDSFKKKQVMDKIQILQNDGKRVILFASKDSNETIYNFDGFIALNDEIRDEVYEAISEAKNASIDVIMITGDGKNTATNISKKLKIIKDESEVYSGVDIDEMSPAVLKREISKIKCIYRATPNTKRIVIKALKEQNMVVAMTGDGINDALALKEADVGIAMGINGTSVCKDASDIVLLNDSFKTIINAIGFGRNILDNFKRFIIFQLTVNISLIILIMGYIIMGKNIPFNALELLWINVIMDGPPAIALGSEGINNYKLKKVVFKRNHPLISIRMILRIIISSLIISSLCLLQANFNYICCSSNEQKSVIFSLFVFLQLINIYNIIEKTLNLKRHFILYLMIILVILVQIFITNYFGNAFNLSPLKMNIWLKILGVCLFTFLLNRLLNKLLRIQT